MCAELRLKKLRGSGGFVMARVSDEQQSKGNLGGPDLFLAPVGRLEAEKISKYTCNTCEKEFEGSPNIEFENPPTNGPILEIFMEDDINNEFLLATVAIAVSFAASIER